MWDERGSVFSTRLTGFSLFWTWLFLVAVSPSPTFGALFGVYGLSFEVPEVTFRILFLLAVLASSRTLATASGRWILPAACMVSGPLAVLALVVAHTGLQVSMAAILVALAEVSMLIMWLCYFGYSKLDETALLLVLSYAIGSIVCLGLAAAGYMAMVVASMFIPVVSGVFFIVSVRDSSESFDRFLVVEESHEDVKESLPSSTKRLTVALCLYAFAFAFYSSRTAGSEFGLAAGPLLQGVASIALAVIVICLVKLRPKDGLYWIYRAIPLVFGIGFACFALAPGSLATAAGFCVMLAYLSFEMMSYNDYCNVVKTNGYSLVRSMGMVRLSASVGILAGWIAGFGFALALPSSFPTTWVAVFGLLVVLGASTLVFTDKDIGELGIIAGNRAIQETAESRPDKMELIPVFAQVHGLSKRETEVAGYLLTGRTTQYIADKLFIAESTARTHVHRIYQKTETDGRMGLLDVFESFYEDQVQH